MDTIEKRITRVEKLARQKDKEASYEYEILSKLKKAFEAEMPARSVDLTKEEKKVVHGLHLLTMKPVLYVANVAEEDLLEGGNELVERVREYAANENAEVIVISAKVESEIAELEGEEKQAFLEELGIEESGLDQLIRAAYNLLGLATYFTAGEQEHSCLDIPSRNESPASGWNHPHRF